MNDNIIQFIKKQTTASVCCVDEEGQPYCFSCFYVFNPDEGLLYFKSSPSTRHAMIMASNPRIAGTILPDKLAALIVKGIQFEGTVLNEIDSLHDKASTYYYKKLPAAIAIPGKIWTLQIESIKMTDSTLGFGKKISWQRSTVPLGV